MDMFKEFSSSSSAAAFVFFPCLFPELQVDVAWWLPYEDQECLRMAGKVGAAAVHTARATRWKSFWADIKRIREHVKHWDITQPFPSSGLDTAAWVTNIDGDKRQQDGRRAEWHHFMRDEIAPLFARPLTPENRAALEYHARRRQRPGVLHVGRTAAEFLVGTLMRLDVFYHEFPSLAKNLVADDADDVDLMLAVCLWSLTALRSRLCQKDFVTTALANIVAYVLEVKGGVPMLYLSLVSIFWVKHDQQAVNINLFDLVHFWFGVELQHHPQRASTVDSVFLASALQRTPVVQ